MEKDKTVKSVGIFEPFDRHTHRPTTDRATSPAIGRIYATNAIDEDRRHRQI